MSNATVWRVDLDTEEGTYLTRKQMRATSLADAEYMYTCLLIDPPAGYATVSLIVDCRLVRSQLLHISYVEPLYDDSIPELDLFDAASYPAPTMSDVAGAYEARLNEQFAELGRVTRKLEMEGYLPDGSFIAIG